MWYQHSFRRHLLDMHINDWQDGRFLSAFDTDVYYRNLRRANVKSVMMFLQSHVGYCYYPTKVGHTHTAFAERPDAVRDFIQRLRGDNIDVVGYYSLNYNNIETIAHPEWAMQSRAQEQKHDFSGEQYIHCCPNNPEYAHFVLTQVSEILDYVELDGMFFDMPFWPYPCYCDHCRAKWRAATGADLPTDRQDPRWIDYLRMREVWTEQFVAAITGHIKARQPGLSVEYNVAYDALNSLENIGSEVINHYADYAAGDIYRNFATQSFACKLYYAITQNQPFEYMTGRCDPNLTCHTLTKSPDKFRLSIMLTAAHHGANFVIDAVNPIGTMDERLYDREGELYREVERYEPYLATGELVADVGLFYSLESRSLHDRSQFCHYEAVVNTAETLARHHIPYGVITQATAHRLEGYKAVILPNPVRLSPATVEALTAYVQRGGILYFSGGKQPELLETLLGGQVIGQTGACAYAAPLPAYETVMDGFNADYPLPFNKAVPLVEGIDPAYVVATVTLPYQSPIYRFSSIHSNPPGESTDYPAVASVPVGAGRVVWCAGVLEAGKPLAYQHILLHLLDDAGLGKPSVVTTASAGTELVAFADDSRILVSAVYVTDNEMTEVQRAFAVSVRCDKVPQRVVLVATDEEVPFTYEDGCVRFNCRELNIFDMYCIEK